MFTSCVFLSTVYFMGFVGFGYSRPHLRIFAGKDADVSKYPYVALMASGVGNQTMLICTCTIITARWSLTAGRCVSSHNKIKTEVQLSQHKKVQALVRYGKSILNGSFTFVTHLLAHPNMKINQNADQLLISNDIGLLKTDPIKLSEYGRISALDYTSFIGQTVLIFGYGMINFNSTHSASYLHKPLQVMVAITQKCDGETYYDMYPVICLAHRCGEISRIGEGDSGGPTIHHSGVIAVSSSFEETKWSHAGRMTPVSPYLDWIYATVTKKDGREDS